MPSKELEAIKQLREQTGAGVIDVKRALAEAKGDMTKAAQILEQKGLAAASKRSGREARAGLVDGYLHLGRLGSLVEVNCETDFVARTDEFKNFVHELAMQVAASSLDQNDVKGLLAEPTIQDPELRVEDRLNQTAAKLGENIVISRFVRYELGADNGA